MIFQMQRWLAVKAKSVMALYQKLNVIRSAICVQSFRLISNATQLMYTILWLEVTVMCMCDGSDYAI